MTGYLFNMATIFEDFISFALAEAFAPHGGRSHSQYRIHLDEDESVSIRPDFAWSDGRTPRVVVDAKYKAEKPSGYPQADLYQMLAYCTVLDLRVGHLVYVKGNEAANRHTVRRSGIETMTHALDLDVEPTELLAEVTRLAIGMPVSSLTAV